MGLTLQSESLALVFRHVELLDRILVTPSYVRIRLAGYELRGFDSPGADDHVRLFVPRAGHLVPDTLEGWRDLPSREYTPVEWNSAAGWLDLELVLHGGGAVSAWAEQAPLGSRAAIGGPRGTLIMTGRPGSWLLAGDETAVPAIRRWLALAGPDATGRVIIEHDGHRVPLEVPAGMELEHVERTADPGAALVSSLGRLAAAGAPDRDPFVFIAAEQRVVRAGRRLLEAWSVDPEQAVVKGYWRQGDIEYHAPH